MVYHLNSLLEDEGLLKVIGSHVHRKCDKNFGNGAR